MSWRIISIETSENIVGNVQITKTAKFRILRRWWYTQPRPRNNLRIGDSIFYFNSLYVFINEL